MLSLPGIHATHNGLLCAPQTTIIVREQEGGGGEDDLEPPTAVAWATVAVPTVIVCHDHYWSHTASILLRHCHCYFFVGVQRNDVQLGGGRRRCPTVLSLIPLLNVHRLILAPSHPNHFVAPVPYHIILFLSAPTPRPSVGASRP